MTHFEIRLFDSCDCEPPTWFPLLMQRNAKNSFQKKFNKISIFI